jgi:hypothetical protein
MAENEKPDAREESQPGAAKAAGTDEQIQEQPVAAPVQVDEDWRKAELEKLMFGADEKKSPAGKILVGIAFVLGVGFIGWLMFGPAAPQPDTSSARRTTPEGLPVPVAPPPPARPPIPEPEPRPYRDLFEVQENFDGGYVIVYTIQPGDNLSTIGEKLHDVTGFPRLVTYQAVEDAYWRKYFSYDEQNEEITTDEQVAERVGEIIMIPVPVPEYPDYDLAAEVDTYNQS